VIQELLEEGITTPVRTEPHIWLEEVDRDEVVVRVAATPVIDADAGTGSRRDPEEEEEDVRPRPGADRGARVRPGSGRVSAGRDGRQAPVTQEYES